MNRARQIISTLIVFLLVSTITSATGTDASTDTAGTISVEHPQINSRLARVQIPFIENRGQADGSIAYYVNMFGGTVFVTNDGEIVYALPGAKDREINGVTLTEKFVGGIAREIQAHEKSSAVINSYIGNDPSKWRSGLPAYGRVDFGEVYKGIEVELKAHANNVEKLFHIQSGANPANIRMSIDGARALTVNQVGELVVETDSGKVKFTTPLAYQELDGIRQHVDVSYAVHGCEYTFNVGEYDNTRDLVIDPLLAATFIGGPGVDGDTIKDIILATDGSVFVAGITSSPDMFTVAPARDYAGGNYDFFVAKLSADLSILEAATYLGGIRDDQAECLALAGDTSIYVAGISYSNDFPVIAGVYDTSRNYALPDDINYNGVIAKLSQVDLGFLTGTWTDGSTLGDLLLGMAVDSDGNVFVTGQTPDTNDLDGAHDMATTGTPAPYQASHNGGDDGFILKLNSDLTGTGAACTFLGGSGNDTINDIAIDTNDTVIIGGTTSSADFPVDNTLGAGGFVARMSNDLSTLEVSTLLAYVSALGCAESGEIYVVGRDSDGSFPVTDGVFDTTHNGETDCFVAKLNPGITAINAATFLGGSGDDFPQDIDMDATGNIVCAGYTTSTDFPTNPNSFSPTINGDNDGFMAKLTYDLTGLDYSTYIGGSGTIDPGDGLLDDWDYYYAVAVDADGNAYVGGTTNSADFPATTGAYDETYTHRDAALALFEMVDNDDDGVPDAEEDLAPNTGDGNNDTIQDSEQNNVASCYTFDGLNYVTLECPPGETFIGVQAVDNPSPDDAPIDEGFFTYNFFSFTVDTGNPGGATTVTMTLAGGHVPTKFYRYGPTPDDPTPHWYDFFFDGTTGAEINRNVIILHFVDGLRGDDDLDAANGIIIDRGGAGFQKDPGHDCFIATAAYGSYLDPNVEALRAFRDRYLLPTAVGRALVAVYYRTSPPVAAYISRHDGLRAITRWGLTPIVYGVQYPRAALLLVFGVVLIFGIRKLERKRRKA